MGQTYAQILDEFLKQWDAATYRTDPERDEGRLLALGNAMQSVLEKLRDAEEP
jgi:hypothetical protein